MAWFRKPVTVGATAASEALWQRRVGALFDAMFADMDADGLAVTALARYMEVADVALATQADAVSLDGGVAFPVFRGFLLMDKDPVLES